MQQLTLFAVVQPARNYLLAAIVKLVRNILFGIFRKRFINFGIEEEGGGGKSDREIPAERKNPVSGT